MRTVPATSPPIPQANKVEVIASVIDAVATGADTTTLIAEAIQYVDRQGAYYPNAAATLGYLARTDTGWTLTDEGLHFVELDATHRAKNISGKILSLPDMTALLADPTGDTLRATWTDLSGETAERRLTTLEQWRNFANQRLPLQAKKVGAASQIARTNGPLVVARHQAELERARRRERKVCPTHHMLLPLSGECNMCL